MSHSKKDQARASLVKQLIKNSQGRIFTVVAKRITPKISFISSVEGVEPSIKPKDYKTLDNSQKRLYNEHIEYFMTMTCRTGVKKQLKGGTSTIAHIDELISVNLTNGKGYRSFSAFNVLSLKIDGHLVEFNRDQVLKTSS